MEQISKLLKELEDEISSKKFIKFYEKIRQKYPPIKPYLTPKELIRCLHNQITPDYVLNDKILSNLILEYQTQSSPQLIGSYLLILFKPGLLKTFSQYKSRLNQYPSLSDVDLWHQIVALFFEEVNHINFNKDKSKIGAKILVRIKNRLRAYFRELYKLLTTEYEFKNNLGLFSLTPTQVNPEEIEAFLEKLVNLGVISETDKYILLATKAYGSSMKDLSQNLSGLSYEAIRQRKARAQRVVFAYLRKKKKNF